MGLSALLSDLWIYLLIAAELVAVAVAVHIVLSGRDVPSTAGWTGLVLLAPFAGLPLYWLFGINRIERKAHRLRPQTSVHGAVDGLAETERAYHLLEDRWPELVPLGHLGDDLTHTPLKDGNRVTPLMNGDLAYPEMLAAVDAAEHSVVLSSYIDDIWCCLGSANWDPRSLRLNFELNVECYDRELAEQLNTLVDQKLASANRLYAKHLSEQPLPIRMRNGFARLFSPYL